MRDYDYHLDADGEPIKVHMKQQDEDAVGAGLVTGDLHKYNQPLNKLEEYEDLEEEHELRLAETTTGSSLDDPLLMVAEEE